MKLIAITAAALVHAASAGLLAERGVKDLEGSLPTIVLELQSCGFTYTTAFGKPTTSTTTITSTFNQGTVTKYPTTTLTPTTFTVTSTTNVAVAATATSTITSTRTQVGLSCTGKAAFKKFKIQAADATVTSRALPWVANVQCTELARYIKPLVTITAEAPVVTVLPSTTVTVKKTGTSTKTVTTTSWATITECAPGTTIQAAATSSK